MTAHSHHLSFHPFSHRTGATTGDEEKTSSDIVADRALAIGFVTVAAIFVVGLWQVLERREPGALTSSTDIALWGGLLAFDAILATLLFIGMAFRATSRARRN